MPRPLTPRLKDFSTFRLPSIYSEERVTEIARAGQFQDIDMDTLRRKLIAVVGMYKEMADTEHSTKIKARAQSKRRGQRIKAGLAEIHTIDQVKIRVGHQKETSLEVVVAYLGLIFNEFSGREPFRAFDWRHNTPSGAFHAFVCSTLTPVSRKPFNPDYIIRRYAKKI